MLKKEILPSQWKKYTKTSENQDLNDFLPETLAWISYRRVINSQQQRIVSLSKYMLFPREIL